MGDRTAAELLDDRIAYWQETNGVLGRDEAGFLVDDLLAQVPPGCDVVIRADGTLARLEYLTHTDHPYRLIPITREGDQ